MAVGAARDGNGQTLDFPSAALMQDTVLVLAATSKAGIPVRCRTRLNVAVRPDPALTVRAQDAVVAPNGSTAILVDRSEPGMSYQLTTANTPVSSAQPATTTLRTKDAALAPVAPSAVPVDGGPVIGGPAPVGAPLPGTGATIALPIGPLAATTTFSVTATRQQPPAATLTLSTTVIVKVNS